MFSQASIILSTMERCLHPGVGVGQTPPSDTAGYGQRAGGTHPTGIHSSFSVLKLKANLSN